LGVVVSYLEHLVAAYLKGSCEPDQSTLDEARCALRTASGAQERGRLLAAIAEALTRDAITRNQS
jgi:hypothetical protein